MITGAGSGIGAAVATLLADGGDLDVIGIDVRWPADKPALTLALTADVRSPDAVQAAFADLDARDLAPLRYLVCAAGIHHRVPTLELTHEQWRTMLAVHLDGSLLCCQQAAPRMVGGGSIVLFSSVAEFFGWPERIDYAVAKAGISAMARSLAAEWAPRGIRSTPSPRATSRRHSSPPPGPGETCRSIRPGSMPWAGWPPRRRLPVRCVSCCRTTRRS
jgi:3-oxoacyl-[acyl-carrier protein] reductase